MPRAVLLYRRYRPIKHRRTGGLFFEIVAGPASLVIPCVRGQWVGDTAPPLDSRPGYFQVPYFQPQAPANPIVPFVRGQWITDEVPSLDSRPRYFQFQYFSAVVPVPPPTIFYQGDGKRRRRKRKRYETQVLFESIEETIRRAVLGLPEPTRPLPQEVAAPVAIDISHGFDAALDQLTLLAEGYQDLSGRVAALRSAVESYEAERRQRIKEDEEDFLMLGF